LNFAFRLALLTHKLSARNEGGGSAVGGGGVGGSCGGVVSGGGGDGAVVVASGGGGGGGAASTRLGPILVSPRQKGNQLLSLFRNVPWRFEDGITPDFILGASACALFVQVKFHLLKAGYVEKRLKGIPRTGPGSFKLRLLIVQRDVDENDGALLELTRLSLAHECTLLVAASLEDAARLLETVKMYEHKPAAVIQERLDESHVVRAQEALTTVRSVNKTDALTLLSAFPNVAGVLTASEAELAVLPGLGDKKIAYLREVFNTPFLGRAEGEG
jgi:DNA excision repair protein ERCC-1